MNKILLLGLFGFAHSGCPDLKSMKASNVDMSHAEGHWYEISFHDIAQVGATCQQNNNTFSIDTGNVKQEFSTKYGPIPFKQTYIYEAVEGESGLYTKYLEGAHDLLTLPTAIVDVIRDEQTGDYTVLTEYTCKSVAGVVKATELRISARTKTLSNETLARVKQVALERGVPEGDIDGLRVVDHSKC